MFQVLFEVFVPAYNCNRENIVMTFPCVILTFFCEIGYFSFCPKVFLNLILRKRLPGFDSYYFSDFSNSAFRNTNY